MKRVALAAALAVAVSIANAHAADQACYSPTESEAEQAVLFETNLMVISSACRNTTYGEFRARNKDAIVRYQNAMIEHFRHTGARNPKSAYDTWQTSLANDFAQKQALTPIAKFCEQSAELLKLAGTLDAKGFRDYAVSHPVDGAHPRCTK